MGDESTSKSERLISFRPPSKSAKLESPPLTTKATCDRPRPWVRTQAHPSLVPLAWPLCSAFRGLFISRVKWLVQPWLQG